MATRDYKATASLPITVAWRCSKCSSVNAWSKTLKTKGYTFGGRKYDKALSEKAKAMALSQMDDELRPLIGAGIQTFREYLKLGLNCKCEKCGNKEAWATPDFLPVNRFILWASIILALVLFVSGGVMEAWFYILLAGLALAFVVFKMNDARICDNRTSKISLLDKKSLPILIVQGEPFRCDDEEIMRAIKGNRGNMFCERCGQVLTKGSTFCKFCGKEVKN